jgi:hypothetical protein
VNGIEAFDGKIGIWPFVEWEAAPRASVKRDRGTIVPKPISVSRQVYFNYVTTHVYNGIIQDFPRGHEVDCPVYIQHDNAPVHFPDYNPAWRRFVAEDNSRFNLSIKTQPPNSPDTNILDLGIFNSLQSLYFDEDQPNSVDGLIAAVQSAWEKYDSKTLEKVWLTHAAVCDQIIQSHGDNDYLIPHMGKD